MRGGVIVVALGEAAQAGRRRSRVQAVDEPEGVVQAGLLDEQALEQVHARIEVGVDVVDDLVDRGALLEDLADPGDHVVEAVGDLAQGEDGRDEVVDEGQDDEHHRHEQDDAGGGHP